MKRFLSQMLVPTTGIILSVLPAYTIAQSDTSQGIEDRGSIHSQQREARRAEFLENNPEIKEQMQQRKTEMESRRSAFEEKYPEAAAEMRSWVEADSGSRQLMREQKEAARAEFESKYPQAVTEMNAMREEGRQEREARRAEMEARRGEFEEKYPEAAAELRSMQEGLGRRGGEFRRRPGKGFGPRFDRHQPDI